MDFTHLLCHFGPLTPSSLPSTLYPCPLSTSYSKFLTYSFSFFFLPFHALTIFLFSLCNQTIKYARSWHLHHHFKSEETCCFGLTTPFWDVIFGTLPQPLHHWLSLRILPPKSSSIPSSSFDKLVLLLATTFLCIPLPLVSFALLSILCTAVHSLKALPPSLSSSNHQNYSQQCSPSSGLQNSYPFQLLAVIPPFIAGTIGTLLVALSVPSSIN
jgi:hypothetical protein